MTKGRVGKKVADEGLKGEEVGKWELADSLPGRDADQVWGDYLPGLREEELLCETEFLSRTSVRSPSLVGTRPLRHMIHINYVFPDF